MYTCAPPKKLILSWLEPCRLFIQELVLVQALWRFACVELVAIMLPQRFCDMCMQPYVGRGVRSNCTRVCPSRQGARRGWVVDELVAGRIMDGLHPQSPLLNQARARLMLKENSTAADMAALNDQIMDLERRMEDLEEQQEQLRAIQDRLASYNTGSQPANHQRTSSQPESEPGQ